MSPPLRLELTSDPLSLRAARLAVTDYSRRNGFGQEVIERVRLAVTEACTNVVLHAYDGGGSDSRYELDARVEEATLVVRIRDSGVGMPSQGATRPTQNFGFGFPVMRATASSVDVVARPGGGTEIVLRFVTP
jgi:serine/threonine-protein kinase RsbW